MTFPNDEARRTYFLEKLREKLKDPAFRKIEGFPIGEDEDILALSDPPYYTACPNPFLEDFIKYYGKAYHPRRTILTREPFAADVAKERTIRSTTPTSTTQKCRIRPSCGTSSTTRSQGMSSSMASADGNDGVAAQLCGDRANGRIAWLHGTSETGCILDDDGQPFSKLGAAARNLERSFTSGHFYRLQLQHASRCGRLQSAEPENILDQVEGECGWMYLTSIAETLQFAPAIALKTHQVDLHGRSVFPVVVNYTVWSDVFVCSECSGEVVFWDAAVDRGELAKAAVMRSLCPHCNARLTKREDAASVGNYTRSNQSTDSQTGKQVPVLIN